MEESTTRKKRPRASEAMDGDDKKRGRPRVEKEGESAADVGAFSQNLLSIPTLKTNRDLIQSSEKIEERRTGLSLG